MKHGVILDLNYEDFPRLTVIKENALGNGNKPLENEDGHVAKIICT